MNTNKASKTLLLIGAGASKTAGLPDDHELLEKLKRLQAPGYFPRELIEIVIESLKSKGIPEEQIGCELVVNSLWNWAKYDTTNEHPMINEYKQYDFDLPYWFKGKNKLFHMISVTNLAFRSSYTTILQPQVSLMYWDPVIKVWDSNLTIVSLNYDTVIEQRCEELQYVIDATITGDNNMPRLLKLHGSIDWVYDTKNTFVEFDKDNSQHMRWLQQRGPAVLHAGPKVFPQLEFLKLYLEFQQRLSTTEHVVVSGYSFHDHHVNYLLETWKNERTIMSKTWRMTIINPDNPIDSANDEIRNLLADLTWEETPMAGAARIKYYEGYFGPAVADAISG